MTSGKQADQGVTGGRHQSGHPIIAAFRMRKSMWLFRALTFSANWLTERSEASSNSMGKTSPVLLPLEDVLYVIEKQELDKVKATLSSSHTTGYI